MPPGPEREPASRAARAAAIAVSALASPVSLAAVSLAAVSLAAVRVPAGRVRPARGFVPSVRGRWCAARLAARTASARPGRGGGAGRVRSVKAGVSSPSTTRRAAAV